MFTHALAFFISAMAYKFARKHANDKRYVFGTAKMGELAAYTSGLVLTVISCYIAYDAINTIVSHETINYLEALPVACVGLFVNILSTFLLGGAFDCTKKEVDEHDHHAHGHSHGHSHGHQEEVYDYDDEDVSVLP